MTTSRAYGMMIAVALLCQLAAAGQVRTPQDAVDELLAADRAFAAASASTNAVEALSATFADEIMMAVPRGGFAEGKDTAIAALRANADNAASRLEWTVVRGGVSADGLHGFTFGYMTLHKPDKSQVPMKYLAYWIRKKDGWRVAALKRRARPAGDVPLAMMPPALPPRLVPPVTDPAAIEAAKKSLEAAERAFSDEAQTLGLGPAFTKYGRPDAVNMGGPADAAFVVGASEIGRTVSGGEPPSPSPVEWSADTSMIASTGDLGITFGTIRLNKPVAGREPIPFFTIWWRESPSAPWRYIAE